MSHTPRNPDFETVVRDSFARQQVMGLVGATLTRVAPGEVEVELPFRADLTQQAGLVHAGITTTAIDTACGYAALTLMVPGSEVVSVNFNVSLLAPAVGGDLVARGRVVRSGRTITFTEGEAYVRAADGSEKQVASMTATMMRVEAG
ncbi:PaaI family thioesterase [Nocardioides daphniae]|uniref:PaaI family thioesterase n=1 Tax=Nocardioides daphniae TaxID=402297 RepID=A0A4P7U7R6_9ACTN|nr:PaaI family thioesterase [Nocardioides daphniae]QCC76130.1 PaaI family thioesterase [Nocardioides daphniae]GGD09809.1 thioesterase superfamily protein [Nocardioides daphniae]